ncbi:metalloprotease family protein [Chitinophaga japonensis]|uniref:Putative zincin peptidase n=1 Tax=Chitinophaga japonensis TaxID=104662 RepID=A0A562TF20_CHIJA|nr:metalloprotease family protein [Chitinophaga japonensis]TWI91580.1 putative zincin peptidase [Chitinophaga japonensis]
MFVPGIVISAVTFPGVVVHEFAHQLFCRLFGVAIFEVKYFQFGNPAGYVLHEPVRNPVHQLWIGIGPFIINSVLAAIIAFPAAIPVFKFGTGSFIDYLLLYLAVSIGMHAFPSTGDAQTMWNSLIRGADTPLWLKVITVPVVGIIYLGALGSFFWLDLLYGMGVSFGLPALLIKVMA